jgi:uncharacterized protein YjbI with pentapeptide repeats
MSPITISINSNTLDQYIAQKKEAEKEGNNGIILSLRDAVIQTYKRNRTLPADQQYNVVFEGNMLGELGGKVIKDIDFRGISFPENMRIARTKFEECNFDGTVISKAKIVNSGLYKCSLKGAKLDRLNFISVGVTNEDTPGYSAVGAFLSIALTILTRSFVSSWIPLFGALSIIIPVTKKSGEYINAYMKGEDTTISDDFHPNPFNVSYFIDNDLTGAEIENSNLINVLMQGGTYKSFSGIKSRVREGNVTVDLSDKIDSIAKETLPKGTAEAEGASPNKSWVSIVNKQKERINTTLEIAC